MYVVVDHFTQFIILAIGNKASNLTPYDVHPPLNDYRLTHIFHPSGLMPFLSCMVEPNVSFPDSVYTYEHDTIYSGTPL